jgi:hypothetical protein
MIRFVRAQGYDPGPTQRPGLAGAVAGFIAAAPAAAAFAGFGSFAVMADEVMRLPRGWAATLLLLAFAAGGLVYGAVFQRAANDRGAGWLLGLAYGFVLWIAAPLLVLPLIRGPAMAAGLAATGFFVAFLLWGLALGLVFPFVHGHVHAGLDDPGRLRRFGPDAVTLRRRLLRRG